LRLLWTGLVGVSDAIAEFIDNSLQATQHNPERRTIQIYFDLNFYSGSSYLTICDNGRGMSEREIMRFAKYCDPKEYETDASRNPTNISRFGVGSKEAGFYLGDRLHVLTKSQELDDVIELVLDESEMEEKQRTNAQSVCFLFSPHTLTV
jgi:HSP90 family molecular chaperone